MFYIKILNEINYFKLSHFSIYYLKLVTILFYIKKLNKINSLITILIQLDLQYGHVMPVLKWSCDVECGVEVVIVTTYTITLGYIQSFDCFEISEYFIVNL